jgi:RsiW-degrading membrane proteinase PrsW (M82 family)
MMAVTYGLTVLDVDIRMLPALVRTVLVVALCLIPAGIWLGIILYQDRTAPEPRTTVFGLFVLGAIIASDVLTPLGEYLAWGSYVDGGTVHLLANGVFRGIIIGALTYVAVRWTVLPTAEFDQHMDGLVYAVAVTMGMATADGITFLVARDVIQLAAAMGILMVYVLVYIAIGAIIGHVLAMIKPGRAPGWVVLVGLASTGGVWALNEFLDRVVVLSSLNQSTWSGMVPAAVVTVVVLALVTLLVRREARADALPNTSTLPVRRADWWVVLACIGALGGSSAVLMQVQSANRVVNHGPFVVMFPGGLIPKQAFRALPAVSRSGVVYSVAERPTAGTAEIDVLREERSLNDGCYRYPNTQISYGTVLEYVCLPSTGSGSVTHGYMLVATVGTTTYTVSVSGDESNAPAVANAWSDVVRRLTRSAK